MPPIVFSTPVGKEVDVAIIRNGKEEIHLPLLRHQERARILREARELLMHEPERYEPSPEPLRFKVRDQATREPLESRSRCRTRVAAVDLSVPNWT